MKNYVNNTRNSSTLEGVNGIKIISEYIVNDYILISRRVPCINLYFYIV